MGFVNTERLQQFFTGLKGIFAPIAHASSGTSYGVGSTTNYGHVKLVTGDMNAATNADGEACSKNHTHSQYATTTALGTLENSVNQLQNQMTNIGSALVYSGSFASPNAVWAHLISLNVSQVRKGMVFNITAAFSTTPDIGNYTFVEGSGVSYEAGTNIAITDFTTSSGDLATVTLDIIGGSLAVPETTYAEVQTILASQKVGVL